MEHITPDAPTGALAALMRGRKTLVLSGPASARSPGSPTTGQQGALRSRIPMQYREFVGSEDACRRYWSRNSVGWSRPRGAKGEIVLTFGT